MENISKALNETSKNPAEDVQVRHRRERKEMQAKVQALKKNAPKSDKKKRKSALEEIAKLEAEMEERQALELKELEVATIVENGKNCPEDKGGSTTATDNNTNSNNDPPAVASDGNDSDFVQSKQPQRISKAQKRREKKSREARKREEEIKVAAEDAMYAPKAVEERKILFKLKKRGLALHNILSDGDCLFNAIRHQLLQQGLGSHSVQSLRYETANYIHANKENLLPYMTNPDTGDLLNDKEFEKYCDDVRNTPAWGGQIELKALSCILKVPIEIIQADGSPTIQGADEFACPPLVITYHRLMYSLGEHYNSTVPMPEGMFGEEDSEA